MPILFPYDFTSGFGGIASCHDGFTNPSAVSCTCACMLCDDMLTVVPVGRVASGGASLPHQMDNVVLPF
jgi:hypothetical protein